MVIVTLEDSTTYLIDTDSEAAAERAVEYKLRNKSDMREIDNSTIIKGFSLEKDSEYYNSDNPYDGVLLKCKTGESYKIHNN